MEQINPNKDICDLGFHRWEILVSDGAEDMCVLLCVCVFSRSEVST